MNILIANVGNVRSNELKALALALNKKHKVTIACMAVEDNYRGQAFSYCGKPVRVNNILYHKGKTKLETIMAYEFHANPADAVSIMLGEIMGNKRPDVVICGINNGVHMGQDIFSSSNIGMAMESAYFGVPAIAVGIENVVGGNKDEDIATAVKFIQKNIEKLSALKLPKHTFTNINIPKNPKGVKITRLGWVNAISQYDKATDHKGGEYFWKKNVERKGESPEGTDIYEFESDQISITPVDYNATSHEELKRYMRLQPNLFREEM